MKINLLFLTLSIVLYGTALFAQDEFTRVKVGDAAPDFTFETAPGQTARLSDFKGKVVWINFFATWCGPCRQVLPHLQKEVYNKYKNNPNFILLILGREHSWDEVTKFKAEQNFTMPFYPDPERKIFSAYAAQNIPRNFIIGKDGKIAVSSTGFTEKEFGEIVEKLEILIQ